MKPTAFEFRVTMPGDARLVGAIRGLAAHAAGYARLNESAGQGLATHVERATATAIAATPEDSTPIDVCFSGNSDTLTVVISYEAMSSAERPPSTSAGDLTIDWALENSRHICRIRQRLSS